MSKVDVLSFRPSPARDQPNPHPVHAMSREDDRAIGYAEAVADLLAWIEKEGRFTTEPEPWSTLRAIHACVREGKHVGCAKLAPRCARAPRRCEDFL